MLAANGTKQVASLPYAAAPLPVRYDFSMFSRCYAERKTSTFECPCFCPSPKCEANTSALGRLRSFVTVRDYSALATC